MRRAVQRSERSGHGTRAVTVAALAGGALLASSSQPLPHVQQGEITLRATPTLVGALECSSELEIDVRDVAASFEIDGKDGPDHDRLLHAFQADRIDWTERSDGTAPGAPPTVTRAFDRVRGTFGFEGIGEAQELRESTGAFEGRIVAFEWDPDASAYQRAFETEAAGDDALEPRLGALAARVDFSGFLPRRAVRVGDHWQVDARAFAAAFSPSGDLAVDPGWERLIGLGSYGGFTAPLVPPVPSLWWTELAATTDEGARVELLEVEVDEESGARIAVLEVEADLAGTSDLAPWLLGFTMEHFEPEIQRLDVGTRVSGEGRLRWDLDAGRPRSWSFEGELELELDAAWELHEGRTFRLRSTRSLRGTLRSTFRCRPAPKAR